MFALRTKDLLSEFRYPKPAPIDIKHPKIESISDNTGVHIRTTARARTCLTEHGTAFDRWRKRNDRENSEEIKK
jgi:hypothetical protein